MSRAAWKVQRQLQRAPALASTAQQLIVTFLLRCDILYLHQSILWYIMSELAFAKSFLSTLDSRPIKIRPDHVFDPERVGLRVPVSLLP